MKMLKFTHKGRLEHLLVSLNVTGLWGVVRGFFINKHDEINQLQTRITTNKSVQWGINLKRRRCSKQLGRQRRRW